MPENPESGTRRRLEAETVTIMRRRFSQIFWGFLIVILDLYGSDGFDFLLDGVGFVLIAVGCGGLVTLSPKFKNARTLAIILTILWFVGHAAPGDAALSLIQTVLGVTMIWILFGGISEFAKMQELPELALSAERRRLVYALVMPVMWVVSLDAPHSPDDATLLAIPGLVVIAFILHLIHRARRELSTQDLPVKG